MRILTALIAAAFASTAFAKLPPPTDEAKAKAAEATTKTAWSDKVGQYKLCLAMDRTANAYRTGLQARGQAVPASVPTPPCADPGPFVTPVTTTAEKPLEAAGAHSPAGTATSPPSTRATASELAGGAKK